MGFISEIFDINKEIINLHVDSKIPILNNFIYKRNIHKLKTKIENNCTKNILYTSLIEEYILYVLENYESHSNHITQITKGSNHYIGSVTFNFDMPDMYSGQVTINFKNKTKNAVYGDFIYIISEPNSGRRMPHSEHDISMYTLHDININEISKTDKGKLEQLKYIMVKTINHDIKTFLFNKIGDMEIQNE
jgi:hypothetical protein